MEVLSAGQRGEQEYILIRNKDEAPGGHRRSPEAREGRRKPQEAPGGPRRPQRGPKRPTNWRAKNVRRASAGVQLSESMCAALRRERHFALSRGECAASHSCHAFCDVDDMTSMLKGKTLILYCFLQVRMGPPGLGCYLPDRGGSRSIY